MKKLIIKLHSLLDTVSGIKSEIVEKTDWDFISSPIEDFERGRLRFQKKNKDGNFDDITIDIKEYEKTNN